ncbi:unnamed protein product [Nyctereutes procyonoides]|uniref:(raccoon dog) hypothetical protein n=1 Tax=Nyctereutes procyonoides TaxID=34880 RepID=A0A811YRR5_NYCPR|nr:unnamed protein product [Nyctereutes procyonoides]
MSHLPHESITVQFAKWLCEAPGEAARSAEEPQLLRGARTCKWFNVRTGLGFLSFFFFFLIFYLFMISKLRMEGFRSLKEGEAGGPPLRRLLKAWSLSGSPPAGVYLSGVGGRPKGRTRRRAGRRDTGATTLPPQPKKGHLCQGISHTVASCPLKAQQAPSSQGKPAYFREEEEIHSPALLPEAQH